MSLWRRILGGLFGVTEGSPGKDTAMPIPDELLREGCEAINYSGALFTREIGEELWKYEGQYYGPRDSELVAKSPMTMATIERHFIMKRIVGMAGKI